MPDELKNLLQRVADQLSAATTEGDPTFVGDPYKDELLTIRGQVLASISALPADKKPESTAAYDQLKVQVAAILGAVTTLSNVIKTRNTEKATALASIPTEVANAIKSKTDAGELITKDAASDLVAKAKQDADKAGFERGRLLGDRKSALALASIPAEVVANAPEAILLADETAFNAARDAAKDRVTKLTGVGLTVASAQFKTLPWAEQPIFDSALGTFTEIAEAAKKTTPTNTTTQPKANGLVAGTANPNPAAFKYIC